jgi:hypothetical protein
MSEKESVFKFLDDLRESGVTNMYGAKSYIMEEFPEFNKYEAKELLMEWMRTFEERHQGEPDDQTKS